MDVNDLESTINSVKRNSNEVPKMTKEEEIGFHKGSISTLSAERNELVKMIGNVEAIMKMHISRIKELGIN